MIFSLFDYLIDCPRQLNFDDVGSLKKHRNMKFCEEWNAWRVAHFVNGF